MTITIDEQLAARIRTAAAARGQEPEAFATAALNRIVEDTTIKLAAPNSKPLSQFIDEQRKKFGYPDDWPDAERYQMTEQDWAAMDAAIPEPSEFSPK